MTEELNWSKLKEKGEIEVDMAQLTDKERSDLIKEMDLLFKLNSTNPTTSTYVELLKKLLGNRIGENSMIRSPVNLVASNNLVIGKNVFIGPNFLGMCRGGIFIEDDVMIAGNVSILSNNHDPYKRSILLCKPVKICKGAWIGANATILPGITVGKYAIVGAGSVVTRDVYDYEVVAGNPARGIKDLDMNKFYEY